MSPDQRAEVDALTVEVAHAIALRLDAALDRSGADDLASLVLRLFAPPLTTHTLEER